MDANCIDKTNAAACEPVGTKAAGSNVYYMNPITGETDCDKDNEYIPCVLVQDGDRLGSQDFFVDQSTYELTTTATVKFTTDAANLKNEPDLATQFVTQPSDLAETASTTTADPITLPDVGVDMKAAKAICVQRYNANPHRFLQADRAPHPYKPVDPVRYDDYDTQDPADLEDDEALFKLCKIIIDMLKSDPDYFD